MAMCPYWHRLHLFITWYLKPCIDIGSTNMITVFCQMVIIWNSTMKTDYSRYMFFNTLVMGTAITVMENLPFMTGMCIRVDSLWWGSGKGQLYIANTLPGEARQVPVVTGIIVTQNSGTCHCMVNDIDTFWHWTQENTKKLSLFAVAMCGINWNTCSHNVYGTISQAKFSKYGNKTKKYKYLLLFTKAWK